MIDDKYGKRLTKNQVENKIEELLNVDMKNLDTDRLKLIHYIICKEDDNFRFDFKNAPNWFKYNNQTIYCDNHLVI
ncbi:hypothetical protein U5U50_02295 [Mycoplasma sp. 888]|uniref:hypothetical protein n=1 Tax=Mycoplasma sp. 888 TaxID=3108483 RepID=UPI002D77A27D|nr:hypothetical protein [Mycoplasma sp. 888]WRQ25616.1 hypothetical protein U5U50_02295 [Mycoplasma sp. 888]